MSRLGFDWTFQDIQDAFKIYGGEDGFIGINEFGRMLSKYMRLFFVCCACMCLQSISAWYRYLNVCIDPTSPPNSTRCDPRCW